MVMHVARLSLALIFIGMSSHALYLTGENRGNPAYYPIVLHPQFYSTDNQWWYSPNDMRPGLYLPPNAIGSFETAFTTFKGEPEQNFFPTMTENEDWINEYGTL